MIKVYSEIKSKSLFYKHVETSKQIAQIIDSHYPNQLIEIEKIVYNKNPEVDRNRARPDILINNKLVVEIERVAKYSIGKKIRDLLKMGFDPVILYVIDLPIELKDRVFVLSLFKDDKGFTFEDLSSFIKEGIGERLRVE